MPSVQARPARAALLNGAPEAAAAAPAACSLPKREAPKVPLLSLQNGSTRRMALYSVWPRPCRCRSRLAVAARYSELRVKVPRQSGTLGARLFLLEVFVNVRSDHCNGGHGRGHRPALCDTIQNRASARHTVNPLPYTRGLSSEPSMAVGALGRLPGRRGAPGAAWYSARWLPGTA